jgi:bifunctional NMN adenylyltransferase/nudix hydrolase
MIVQKGNEILLGKRNTEPKYRFFGGFVSPKDESLESAAIRELTEEAGSFEKGAPQYLGSIRVDDWRYKHEEDKILTAVFLVPYVFGRPEPGDDIDEVRWFHINDIGQNLQPEHLDLWLKIKQKVLGSSLDTR